MIECLPPKYKALASTPALINEHINKTLKKNLALVFKTGGSLEERERALEGYSTKGR